MDDDIKDIINQVFAVQDATVVEQMLDVINRNVSEARKQKVINEIDQILQDVQQ